MSHSSVCVSGRVWICRRRGSTNPGALVGKWQQEGDRAPFFVLLFREQMGKRPGVSVACPLPTCATAELTCGRHTKEVDGECVVDATPERRTLAADIGVTDAQLFLHRGDSVTAGNSSIYCSTCARAKGEEVVRTTVTDSAHFHGTAGPFTPPDANGRKTHRLLTLQQHQCLRDKPDARYVDTCVSTGPAHTHCTIANDCSIDVVQLQGGSVHFAPGMLEQFYGAPHASVPSVSAMYGAAAPMP